MKVKLTTILLATVLGLTQASAQIGEKKLAMEGLDKIMSYYRQSILRLSLGGGSTQDIEMACMGEIYLEWFYAYKSVIKNTPDLSFAEVDNYRESEQLAHLNESDRLVYNQMRPDLSAKILGSIDQRRLAQAWNAGPAGISLENPKDKALLANLQNCLDKEFIAELDTAYEISEDDFEKTVSVIIPGYKPDYKPGELPKLNEGKLFDEIDSNPANYKKSYLEWLEGVQLRR